MRLKPLRRNNIVRFSITLNMGSRIGSLDRPGVRRRSRRPCSRAVISATITEPPFEGVLMRRRHRAPTLLTLGAAALGLQAAPTGGHRSGRKPGDGAVYRSCTPSDTVQVPGAAAAVTACL